MKHILLSAGCALMVLCTQAQVKQSTIPTENSFNEDTHVLHFSSPRGAGGASGTIANQVDTIWYEDFGSGIPNGWTLSGAGSSDCPWVYSTDGSWGYFNGNNGTSGATPINSTTGSNGFMINDPDSANNTLFGQPSSTSYQYLESYITTTAISTVGYPAVRLEFEQLFRYNNSPELQVGVSTDGINFTFFDAKGDVSANDESQNPNLFSVDISTIAGNAPTIYLRFGWSARVYYWMIDDIRLVTPPNYDLAINQTYFNGYQDSTQLSYYTSIPEKQANEDVVLLGAAIQNLGAEISSNSKLNVSAYKDGSQIWQESSITKNIQPAQIDSFNAISSFSPNQGIGSYSLEFKSSSDSSDYDTTNNVLTTTFEVTGNLYSRDNDNSNQGNWYDTPQWEMLVGYEIHQKDTAIGVSCYFPDLNNGYGLKVGDPLSYYIYNSNDLTTPVVSNEFYAVQASDVDSWVTLPMPANTTLDSGYYYVGFKIITNEIAIATHTGLNENVSPQMVLVRTDQPDWSYTTTLMPFVRLITRNSSLCDTTTIDVTGTVVDSSYLGSITIDVSGGTQPYSYQWTGPNGYTTTTKDLSSITTKGIYTVVVTDASGCSADPVDFTVAGVVTVENAKQANTNFLVYPNPATDQFYIVAEEANKTEKVKVYLYDISGKVVYETTTTFGNKSALKLETHFLSKGVYFLKLSTENTILQTEKILLK